MSIKPTQSSDFYSHSERRLPRKIDFKPAPHNPNHSAPPPPSIATIVQEQFNRMDPTQQSQDQEDK